ncbi:ras-like protein [Anaeramoeba ignava]|uniref:small monomeric GTPase n=1 Tax=Anaeramoeba ignava TaxID=1746090 RepID=A0A9Q0REJ8_ANAIG|nr:ras-like protein [Anaeramoeba ignava]
MSETRLVVVGSGAVGKSALTIRFVHSQFIETYEPTIEETFRKQIELEGRNCYLEILDTAGQEEYALMRDSYMRNGDGFLAVFSIVKKTTFEEIQRIHTLILRTKETDFVPVVLVGNKVDLENHEITQKDAENLASSWKCPYIETSAKTNFNVENAFFTAVKEVWKTKSDYNSNSTHVFKERQHKKKCFLI